MLHPIDLATNSVELSIISPCFNERPNIAKLVELLEMALRDVAWEIIFVDDDSPDGTSDVARVLGRKNPRVRCIQRIGRRGLSSAVVEGMLASCAPYLAVIDADLQHDETLLPKMLDAIRSGKYDIVVGSRFIGGGGLGDWEARRASMSRFAAWLSRLVVKQELTDPMSGFFIMRRETLEIAVRHLSGQGYKILLDLFASSPKPLRFCELPYTFRSRQHGESKLDALVLWEYLELLLDKLIGWLIPVRFVTFSLVGLTGVGVHLLVLRASLGALDFVYAQALAAVAAMTSNFFVNNLLTYRDRRLSGWQTLKGLAAFYAVCSVGVVANVGIAARLFGQSVSWFLAALAGIVVGAVWNYAVSGVFVWQRG